MISAVVQEAACPVIALLDTDDAAMITEAAKRGVFAYVILTDVRKTSRTRSTSRSAALRSSSTFRGRSAGER